MRYLESPSTNPCFNLALEQHMFDTVGQTEDIFMLWQNNNAIVIGRHQNTAEEINADFVQEQGITVVRRLSGGGAVYHDLGNLNFTFIAGSGDKGLDLRLFCRPVAAALEALGVPVEISGRNDMTVDGKKFSGNAQYRKNGRVMHHGTLLFDSDLTVLSKALKVSEDKISSKGVKSVRGRVTNLRPYLPDGVSLEKLKNSLASSVAGSSTLLPYVLTAGDLAQVEFLRASRYATWDWNWGSSPKYELRRERRVEGVGKIELYLKVEQGILTGLELYGDFFGDGESAVLADELVGCPMEESALQGALKKLDLDRYIHNLTAAELCRIILA